MKKMIARVVALDMIFLLLLMVAGAFSGAVSQIIYIAAYLLPLGAAFRISRGERRTRLSLLIGREDALLCLPLIAPTIGVTLGLSALIAFLLSLTGAGAAAPLSGSLLELLILHALLPAVLEEALFRYVPLALISQYSKRSAVIISAVLFAVAHCNASQIPYAFVAGIVFAALDLACGSILPSCVLHLLNNLASFFWQWEVSAPAFRIPFVISVSVLSVISCALVAIFRIRYSKKAAFMLDKNDKIIISREVWVFVAVCAALALGALI